jgi:hypothetical protein
VKVEFVIVLCKILYEGLLASLQLHVIWSGFMFDSSFNSTLFTVFFSFLFNTSFQNIDPSRQPLHEFNHIFSFLFCAFDSHHIKNSLPSTVLRFFNTGNQLQGTGQPDLDSHLACLS